MSIVQTGKWRKPTGVLVDQVGHLLVVDQVQLSPQVTKTHKPNAG